METNSLNLDRSRRSRESDVDDQDLLEEIQGLIEASSVHAITIAVGNAVSAKSDEHTPGVYDVASSLIYKAAALLKGQ